MSEVPIVVFQNPGASALLHRGALVSVRCAAYRSGELDAIRDAFEREAHAHPGGFVSLTSFRLDPAFPLQSDYEGHLGALVETARAIDRHLVAVASVLAFGGIRRTAMETMSRVVWRLARPRAEMTFLDTLTDALVWLEPRARVVGALHEPAALVQLHQQAERLLADAAPAR